MAQLGIITPVLNDVAALAALLHWRNEVCPAVPLWVVDGGGRDHSVRLASEAGAAVLRTMPGRAVQMNRGAHAAIEAGCDVLWFVHADSIPPDDAVPSIISALRDGANGGAFRRRFDHRSRFLRITCLLADWRGRFSGWFLGDQGIFVTASMFDLLGGFPEWHAFEDLEFSRRMRRNGRTVMLSPPLRSSGRRFEPLGPVRQTMRDASMTWNYLNCQDSPQVCIDEYVGSRRHAGAEKHLIP